MKQRFTKRTRFVSALLTLAMVFTFLPFSAFAANTEIDFNSPDFVLKFQDAEFQRFLKERCDTNHNGKLDAQELNITEMTITDDYKIRNLEGIRFFENLEKLDCHGIGLTTLNVGKNFKLKELDCSHNKLKEYYPILSSGLKILNCSHNKLTHMNLGILTGLNLEEVNCSNNNITKIVMDSVGELVKFDCSNNDLMTLDVSQCFKLEELNCSGNQLMELNVKNQTNLTLLDCHHNELTELDVSQNQNLASLTCDGNQLTTLDLSKNTSLSHLSCAENRLACVDFSHMVGSAINAGGNRHPIAVLTDRTFDLNTLPGFDVSKATNWNGGSVPGSGTILTVEDGKNEVSYQYDCGKGVKPTFIFETSLPINEKNFPDPNFRNYIQTYKAGGRNVLTVEEQRKVDTIDVKGWNISNLKGIEAFPNLKELNCENNSIQKLDLRQNPELEKLICNKNQLTQLDLSKNPNIYFLNCSWNQLEQLDVSHLKDLVTLDCSHNDLEQTITVVGEYGEHTFTVANGFLDADFQSGRGNERGTAPDLYVSQQALKKLSKETKIFRIAFDTVDSSYDKEIMAQLQSITALSSGIDIQSRYEKQQEMAGYLLTSRVLATGLSAVFLLIGIMNFINTMVVSVNTRKHEFATLESIGMTKKQIRNVLLWEGGYYWSISFLLLATLGTAIYIPIYSVFRKMVPYAAFSYPLIPLLAVAAIVLLVCFATPVITFKQNLKESVVERLRQN